MSKEEQIIALLENIQKQISSLEKTIMLNSKLLMKDLML